MGESPYTQGNRLIWEILAEDGMEEDIGDRKDRVHLRLENLAEELEEISKERDRLSKTVKVLELAEETQGKENAGEAGIVAVKVEKLSNFLADAISNALEEDRWRCCLGQSRTTCRFLSFGHRNTPNSRI